MSPERRAQIVRLLETRDDHLPTPPARPLSRLGFVHRAQARESCSDCLANGRAMAGCVTCGGRGYVEARRGRDPYDSGQSLGVFGESSRRHEAVRERDAEIARLEAQVEPPRSEADLQAETRPEAWETARARAWAMFDYAALDVGLSILKLVDPQASAVLHSRIVYGWKPHPLGPHPAEDIALERGLHWLDVRLPEPLRAPAPVAPFVPEPPRDSEIRRLIRDGAAAQWVARRFGLSVSQVYRVAGSKRERS